MREKIQLDRYYFKLATVIFFHIFVGSIEDFHCVKVWTHWNSSSRNYWEEFLFPVFQRSLTIRKSCIAAASNYWFLCRGGFPDRMGCRTPRIFETKNFLYRKLAFRTAMTSVAHGLVQNVSNNCTRKSRWKSLCVPSASIELTRLTPFPSNWLDL